MTDLAGRTVLPGFCDTHMHLLTVAQQLIMVQFEDAETVGDIVVAVRQHTELVEKGHWIQCFSAVPKKSRQMRAGLALPPRADLDRVAPDHPVFLYRRPLKATLNSLAIRLLGDDLGTYPDTEWDPETGAMAGFGVRAVRERLLREFARERDYALRVLAAVCKRLLAMGVTTIVDPGQPGGFDEAWRLYDAARSQGVLPQRVRLMHHLDNREAFEEQVSRLKGAVVDPLAGDDAVRAHGLKVLLDGEFSDAWMRDGEELATPARRWYSEAQLRQLVEMAAVNGWPLCVHAMGGGAIRAAIEATREVQQEIGGLSPGQVSLAHGFLMDYRDMSDCAQLGISVSSHPLLGYAFADEMREAWGPLAARANPIASMLAAGVGVGGGSDTLPCNPLYGAAHAVIRRTWNGQSLGSSEAISPYDAINLFVGKGGEYLNDLRIGRIAPGAFADLTVWDQDPLRVPPERWLELESRMTIVGGMDVWRASDLT
ncbi:amidohydrolase [Streptomyces sp. NPDC004227]